MRAVGAAGRLSVDPISFVMQEENVWSTDPDNDRTDDCLSHLSHSG